MNASSMLVPFEAVQLFLDVYLKRDITAEWENPIAVAWLVPRELLYLLHQTSYDPKAPVFLVLNWEREMFFVRPAREGHDHYERTDDDGRSTFWESTADLTLPILRSIISNSKRNGTMHDPVEL